MSRKAVGSLAIAIGAFMGLGIALNVGEGFGVLAFVLAFAFCSALPIGVGIRLLRGGRHGALAASAEQAWESELLRLAERRGGSLTVAEAVAHADLSREDAERHLERLCIKGVAEHRIS